jgi:MoaA/NifB/PqqE/SkfB family radical SAM enzyme
MAIDWQYYHWHVEPSAICALKCPRCPRTEHPDTPWLNHSMSLEFFQRFMPPERLRTQVKRLTMCGDVGDPIYCKDYLKIYRYVKETNPDVHVFTITNGSGKDIKWWKEFAAIANARDTINFSVDGYDQASNNLYRINSRWDSIISGMTTLRENNSDIFMNWAMIVFRFNQSRIDHIEQMARSLKFDGLQITKSTKFGSKYGDAYQGDHDVLEPDAQWISSTHRYERETRNLSGRIQDTQDYINHNHQRWKIISEKYQSAPIIPLCEIGNRGIYVNAEGVVFPCSWVSFPYDSLSDGKKTIRWADSFFARYRNEMNLHHRSLDEILRDPLWSKCSKGWQDPGKTWVECSQKCQRELVTENYAVGWETN